MSDVERGCIKISIKGKTIPLTEFMPWGSIGMVATMIQGYSRCARVHSDSTREQVCGQALKIRRKLRKEKGRSLSDVEFTGVVIEIMYAWVEKLSSIPPELHFLFEEFSS